MPGVLMDSIGIGIMLGLILLVTLICILLLLYAQSSAFVSLARWVVPIGFVLFIGALIQLPNEASYLPWFDAEGRFYSVGKLMTRFDDGGERESLKCGVCGCEVQFIYPSMRKDGEPFEADCTCCEYKVTAKRATELWEKVTAPIAE